MAVAIRKGEYFYVTIPDRPGEAYKLLAQLAEMGMNLMAFTAVPVGPQHTQLALFPEDSEKMAYTAQRAGWRLDGPHCAFLVQGNDELGALAQIHHDLFNAGVNVYASSGVTDGAGRFGYVMYVKPEEFDRAAAALGV